MQLLVLGGTHFVGRAVVEDALARRWAVTTLSRGRSPVPPGAEALVGDREAPGGLDALAGRRFDAVVDTWSAAPRVVQASARALAGSAGAYLHVSTASVYAWPPPPGADESAPVVDADPGADATDYAADKRGAELAVLDAFGDAAVLARAGTILGPHEDIGRLPWWLLRLHRGGRVLAPGEPDAPLQLVDARDLAAWLLDAWLAGARGAFNVVSRVGHTTMGGLLEACRDVTGGDAELVWTPAERILAAGIAPWIELPLWLPAGSGDVALMRLDVERAHAAGLRPRRVRDSVRDRWTWLRSRDLVPTSRPDRPVVGLDPERERAVLDGHAG